MKSAPLSYLGVHRILCNIFLRESHPFSLRIVHNVDTVEVHVHCLVHEIVVAYAAVSECEANLASVCEPWAYASVWPTIFTVYDCST